MPLKSDKIPNKALNGEEVLEIAVKQFRQMLERDCTFGRGIAYRRVSMTLSATFHLGYPHPVYEVKSRVRPDGVLEGEAPLSPEPEEGAAVALERDVDVENPNLARVHNGLPIRIQEQTAPQPLKNDGIPGEVPAGVLDPFPAMKVHEVRYDTKDLPPTAPPVDRDVSEAAAGKMGVKRGLGLKERR